MENNSNTFTSSESNFNSWYEPCNWSEGFYVAHTPAINDYAIENDRPFIYAQAGLGVKTE